MSWLYSSYFFIIKEFSLAITIGQKSEGLTSVISVTFDLFA